MDDIMESGNILMQLVAQAPGTCAVIIVVIVFLRAVREANEVIQSTLRDINDANNRAQTATSDSLKELQREAVQALHENTRIIGENSEVIRDFRRYLDLVARDQRDHSPSKG